MSLLLSFQDVHHTYKQAAELLPVLKGISFSVQKCEIIALTGASGAGKSTLLHLAGLLESPTQGEILLEGIDCAKLDDQARTLKRRHAIGFVYQFHHLLPEFTALENVMMPALIANQTKAEAKQRAEKLLSRLGLSHRLSHKPKKLSGGEQQRVAIARALVNEPRLLIADEPTGNLDQDTAETVLNEMMTLVQETGLAALIATHDLNLAQRMTRRLQLHKGMLNDSL